MIMVVFLYFIILFFGGIFVEVLFWNVFFRKLFIFFNLDDVVFSYFLFVVVCMFCVFFMFLVWFNMK